MTGRKILAAFCLAVAAALSAAGCKQDGSVPGQVPASFTPSPCPPGWHRISDGDCIYSGTLAPGQPLPLPTINGTPLPVPPPLVRATSTGNGVTT